MGRHLATCRTPLDKISPNGIKYTLSKRIAIAEDIAAGFPYREVAARHGVALATIHAAVKDPAIQEMISPELVERRRKNMHRLYEFQADCALSSLTPEKWEKERPTSVVIAAATCTDKARLLRGESTENIAVRGTVEMLRDEALELRKKRESLGI